MGSTEIIYYRPTRVPATVRPMKTTNTTPQMVLDKATLHRASRNLSAIMLLGSPLATASVEWQAPVYWVSMTNPDRLLGRLLEQYHGIYPSAPNTLRIQMGEAGADYHLPQPIPSLDIHQAQWLMAQALQWHLDGISRAKIQSHINRSVINQLPVKEAA